MDDKLRRPSAGQAPRGRPPLQGCRPSKELDLSYKRVRLRGPATRIHLAMVVTFLLMSALLLIIGRFSGSLALSFGVVIAVLREVRFTVARVTK
ncbi:MAG TPA: hypothetical protein VFJ16_00855 [Longimicrobium sp.]|nr:hypothetical protein [Longimicrobium sp.]